MRVYLVNRNSLYILSFFLLLGNFFVGGRIEELSFKQTIKQLNNYYNTIMHLREDQRKSDYK
jgi:hypothetical protein